jgi:hypothetical protein
LHGGGGASSGGFHRALLSQKGRGVAAAGTVACRGKLHIKVDKLDYRRGLSRDYSLGQDEARATNVH